MSDNTVWDADDWDDNSYVPEAVCDCDGDKIDWYDEYGMSISDFF